MSRPLARALRIELRLSELEAEVLPLNDTRIFESRRVAHTSPYYTYLDSPFDSAKPLNKQLAPTGRM